MARHNRQDYVLPGRVWRKARLASTMGSLVPDEPNGTTDAKNFSGKRHVNGL